jgi:ethanolamine utilization protein EutN
MTANAYARAVYLGIVKGTVIADRKSAGLEGKKLMLVQPIDEHGAPAGELHAAVDTVQAGDGDLVYLVGSREAALACDPSFVPVDAAIVGIVDGIDAPHPPRGPAPSAPGGKSRP